MLVAIVFLLAFGLRVYDLAYPPFLWEDEASHVAAATRYWSDGQFLPDYWEHPPLRHLLLRGFLAAFGDGPYGWRLRNVLFGAAAAALTCLFALEVGGSRRAAALAGVLLATDPLHVVMSRYTWEEIYGGAFFLASLLLHLTHRRRSHRLVLAALLMGCALATKWYYVPCWLVVGGLALWQDGTWRSPRDVAFVTCTWLLVPPGVYTLAYWPWFARGYTFPELVEQTLNGYHSLQALTVRSYPAGMRFLAHQSSLEWFTGWIVEGHGALLGGGRGEFQLYMSDGPVWLLALPALVGLAALAWRRRQPALALPALFFFSTWSLFLFVDRPAFLYSAVPLLPFAFTAVAIALVRLGDRLSPRAWIAVLAVALAWGLFLYPVATAKKVPLGPYRFLLQREGVRIE